MSVFLITGSNRGIGLELCKQLHKRGEQIIATCRKTSNELSEIGVRVFEGIDICSAECITNLKNELKSSKIDCLIHNAGISEYNSLNDLDLESIKKQFEVNALAPLFMTKLLLPLLNKNSKIAFITSRMGSIEDNCSGSSYGYRMSKVALSMAAKSLAIDLLKREIYIAILHPGLVSTRMTAFTKKGIDPEESVKGILNRVDELNQNNSGTFWHANGEVLPW